MEHPDPATYCCVHSARLLMMDRKPVRYMWSSNPKKYIREISASPWFYYKCNTFLFAIPPFSLRIQSAPSWSLHFSTWFLLCTDFTNTFFFPRPNSRFSFSCVQFLHYVLPSIIQTLLSSALCLRTL
jgi:hypothetical protein